jgi:drug/metabolite transporter (DMT)-like permease
MVLFTSISVMPDVLEADGGDGALTVLLSIDGLGWIGLGAFGLALFTINTQIFRSKAYKLAESGSQLAPLIFTNMLFSALWQGLFFDDVFSTQQILGINLIVVASITNTLLAKRQYKVKTKQLPRTTVNALNSETLGSVAKS